MTSLPTWEQFIAPVLRVQSDGETRSLREIRSLTAQGEGLTDEQLADALPSGQSRAGNRIGWAVSYLQRVDALHRPSRGQYVITDKGRQLLGAHPGGVREADLRAVARDGDTWWSTPAKESAAPSEPVEAELDPTEQVEQGIARIHEDVSSQLLARLCEQDPTFFEAAVVKLLIAMGYGGATGTGVVTARTNDGGIDGIIDQDVLGLSKVYLQAKRYAAGNAVQRPEVQGFVGALSGKAESGVFITTSRFSAGAKEWVDRVPARIILIGGARLAELMIRYNVGVQEKKAYRIVEIDEDFFA